VSDRKAGAIIIAFLAAVILVIILLFWLFTQMMNGYAERQCNERWAEWEHKWSYNTGCMVFDGGKWWPADNMRNER
jgi:hypothetical protein